MQLVGAGTPNTVQNREVVLTSGDLHPGTLSTDLVLLLAGRRNSFGVGNYQLVAGSGLTEITSTVGSGLFFHTRTGAALAGDITFPITLRDQFDTTFTAAHTACLFTFRGDRDGLPARITYYAGDAGTTTEPGDEDAEWDRATWNSGGTSVVSSVTNPDPLLAHSWAYLKLAAPAFDEPDQLTSFDGRGVNTDQGRSTVTDLMVARYATGYDNTGGDQPRYSPMPNITPSDALAWHWIAVGFPGDPWELPGPARRPGGLGIYH